MACVAMVKRDERNSKFCNSVEGKKEENRTRKAAGGESLSESLAVSIPLSAQTKLFIRSGRLLQPTLRGFPKHQEHKIMIMPGHTIQFPDRLVSG